MTRRRTSSARQIVAELVIGVAACAGIYLLGVDPAERKLAQVHGQIRILREEIQSAESTSASTDQAEATLAQARALAAAVAGRSRMALSEAEMMEAIAGLGTRHDVRIDDLRPASPRIPLKAKPDAKIPPGDRLVAYAFSMVADFAATAALLDDARRELGFAVVQSVKVQPAEGPGERLVRVTVQTEHRAFDTSGLAAAGAALAPPGTVTDGGGEH
jgi:hypothetical protein